jgi:hypothetical protein
VIIVIRRRQKMTGYLVICNLVGIFHNTDFIICIQEEEDDKYAEIIGNQTDVADGYQTI